MDISGKVRGEYEADKGGVGYPLEKGKKYLVRSPSSELTRRLCHLGWTKNTKHGQLSNGTEK